MIYYFYQFCPHPFLFFFLFLKFFSFQFHPSIKKLLLIFLSILIIILLIPILFWIILYNWFVFNFILQYLIDWELGFMIFFLIKCFGSNDSGHEFEKLTRVDNFILNWLYNFIYWVILISWSRMRVWRNISG